MEHKAQELHHSVAITGDLSAETWPAHLSTFERFFIITALINHHGLRVRSLINVTVMSNPARQFLVGNQSHSRKLMIDDRDQMGVIYLITDDGTANFDLEAQVDRAVTIGKLKQNFELLELDKFKNNRLA